MKLIRIIVVVVMSTLVWIAGHGEPVGACSCAQVAPEESFEQASDVFVGRIELVDDSDEFREPYEVDYVMRIDGVFKGEAFSSQLVTTPQRGGACGVEMTVNGSYLVHASRRNDTELFTSLCAGNQPLGLDGASVLLGDAAEPRAGVDPAVIERAGVGVSTSEVSVPDWVWAAGLLIGSGLLAAAGMVLGRRSRHEGPDDDMIG